MVQIINIHTLEKFIENKDVKIMARKPDIATIKKERNCRVIYILMPWDPCFKERRR